jgi:hypothetical protein
VRKVQLLLALSETGTPDGLAAALGEEADRWRSGATPPLRVRWGTRLPEDPFATTEQGRSAGSFGIDGFIDAAGPVAPAVLEELGAGAGGRLGAQVDGSRSAAVAGEEHVIVGGDEAVLLVYALRRLSALTHEQFCDHWLNRHAEFGRRVPGLRGYRQFHADESATAAAAAAAGVGITDLDGVAEAFYADVQDFLALMATPEVAADAMEDEKRFIDHARSAGSVTGVHTVDS